MALRAGVLVGTSQLGDEAQARWRWNLSTVVVVSATVIRISFPSVSCANSDDRRGLVCSGVVVRRSAGMEVAVLLPFSVLTLGDVPVELGVADALASGVHVAGDGEAQQLAGVDELPDGFRLTPKCSAA
ncbi:hypothetical protein ACFSC4_30000 [Deinococcus malanensis]|uniref:hypothetical protein n=1 Tax=Deinococcus malanensis TaxID=1706855 RepID=UPI003628F1F6